MSEDRRAYVGVGSNIEREHNVRRGLTLLRERFGPLCVSSVYESDAMGFDGEPFYNLVVGFDTPLAAEELRHALHDIEHLCDRDRDAAGSLARTLDLDLLLLGDLVRRDGEFQLPRDEVTCYAFVLRPLAEIAGERTHPLLKRSFAELWAAFDAPEQTIRRLGDPLFHDEVL